MIEFGLLIGALIVGLTSTGQILLKLGAKRGKKLIFNRYVISGYLCFITVIFLSALLMKHVEFKYFTIIISMNYMVTSMMAVIILKEKITMSTITGIILITTGAIIFTL